MQRKIKNVTSTMVSARLPAMMVENSSKPMIEWDWPELLRKRRSLRKRRKLRERQHGFESVR
jgi:hypothetical protein